MLLVPLKSRNRTMSIKSNVKFRPDALYIGIVYTLYTNCYSWNLKNSGKAHSVADEKEG